MTSKPLRTLSKDGSVHVTDEFYNTLISASAAFLSLVGTILLVTYSLQAHKSWHAVSFLIYGFFLVLLFVASALHHGIDGSEKTELFFKRLDYYVIFLQIAGTFTPLCLILLKNKFGFIVLATIWSIAILGIALQVMIPHLPKWCSTALYIGMGWCGIFLFKPIYELAPQAMMMFLVGGLFLPEEPAFFF